MDVPKSGTPHSDKPLVAQDKSQSAGDKFQQNMDKAKRSVVEVPNVIAGADSTPEQDKRKPLKSKVAPTKRNRAADQEQKVVNAVFDDVFRVDQSTSRPKARKFDDLMDGDMGNLIPIEAKKKKDKADKKAEKSKIKKKSLWDEDDIEDAIRGEQKSEEEGILSGVSSTKAPIYGVIAVIAVLILIILWLVLYS